MAPPIGGAMNFTPYQNQPSYQPRWSPQPTGLISVTGIDGAKAYPLAPNSQVALFDASSDTMYVKSTDGAGFPTIRTFTFTEVVEPPKPQGDFVMREDFERLMQKVEELAKGGRDGE